MPYANRYSATVNDGFTELLNAMGARVERIPAPQSFTALSACHKLVYDYEIVRCLADERENHWQQLSETAQAALQKANAVSDDAYQEALGIQRAANEWFEQFFHDYDAIVTPSATGEPPLYGDGTGDPICCTTWTLCGLPCVSLPLLRGSKDLPIGVQLVGSTDTDDRLLRSTRWLLSLLQASAAD
jgi:Asp-tRNA(Asn)/Glu-tRNA(Gln) amidotransferase A subunit family amidase